MGGGDHDAAAETEVGGGEVYRRRGAKTDVGYIAAGIPYAPAQGFEDLFRALPGVPAHQDSICFQQLRQKKADSIGQVFIPIPVVHSTNIVGFEYFHFRLPLLGLAERL